MIADQRARSWARQAITTQAEFALKLPEGKWASAPSFKSAMCVSTTAWSRCSDWDHCDRGGPVGGEGEVAPVGVELCLGLVGAARPRPPTRRSPRADRSGPHAEAPSARHDVRGGRAPGPSGHADLRDEETEPRSSCSPRTRTAPRESSLSAGQPRWDTPRWEPRGRWRPCRASPGAPDPTASTASRGRAECRRAGG